MAGESYDVALSEPAVQARAHAFELEKSLYEQLGDGDLGNVEMPLLHYFADGVYVRAIFMTKGAFVVGKIHKHEHLALMLSGDISIVDMTGAKRMTGPQLPFISQAGTKRALVIHADTWFLTIHRQREYDTSDLAAIESAYAANTEEEFRIFVHEELALQAPEQMNQTEVLQ